MTSRKNRRGKKSTIEQAEDDKMQLTEEANVSSPGAGWAASPKPSQDDDKTENEEEPINLALILKELRDIRKEVKGFRKDTKKQLQDIRGELGKINARLS